MEFIWKALGSFVIYGLEFWMKKSKHNAEMLESYYEFLNQVDKSGAAKVANYISADDALKSKQDELRKELESRSLRPAIDSLPMEDKMSRIYMFALKQEGVKEWRKGSNPQVEEYHRYASKDNDESKTDDVAWCSALVCFCVEMAGFKSTDSRLARSWLSWGKEVSDPKEGDIVVFWRSSRESWKGHVGFFVGFDERGNVLCLGGNQGDEVNISTYNRSRVLSFRRI